MKTGDVPVRSPDFERKPMSEPSLVGGLNLKTMSQLALCNSQLNGKKNIQLVQTAKQLWIYHSSPHSMAIVGLSLVFQIDVNGNIRKPADGETPSATFPKMKLVQCARISSR